MKYVGIERLNFLQVIALTYLFFYCIPHKGGDGPAVREEFKRREAVFPTRVGMVRTT
jgi:hypothetical protein